MVGLAATCYVLEAAQARWSAPPAFRARPTSLAQTVWSACSDPRARACRRSHGAPGPQAARETGREVAHVRPSRLATFTTALATVHGRACPLSTDTKSQDTQRRPRSSKRVGFLALCEHLTISDAG